jgi:hypothetical protein
MILSENRFPLFRIMLLEGHAYSARFAPDDAAWPLQLVRRHGKVSETLRTVQSIAPPPNWIDPAFKTRRRGAVRGSVIKPTYA